MTNAELKVQELASKVTDMIDKLKLAGEDDSTILGEIKSYLLGLDDGLSFAEEMRQPDMSVQACVDGPRPVVGNGPDYTIAGGPNIDARKYWKKDQTEIQKLH
jgi:hypothetical protein